MNTATGIALGSLLRVLALSVLLLSSAPASAANKAKQNVDRSAQTAVIDHEINQILQQENVPASPKTGDAEFLRRVYLDILGVIPTAEEAKAFLDSKAPNKREALIDQLLGDPRYGTHFADVWQDKLITPTSDIRRLNKQPLRDWLTENFNNNTPWNEFTYNLITATGSQDKNGAVTYFLGNSSIDRLTDNVTRQFLGVQLQCAQCHNHPFVNWKQEEYWGMALFFEKVKMGNVNQAAKNGGGVEVTEISVDNKAKGKNNKRQRGFRLPISAKRVPPKFLQEEEPKLDSKQPYRPILAQWMTSAENPYFAKAMVNRTWFHFFGRGLVNPIDDMHADNPATHPELFAKLTQGFAAGGFDVKELIRTVCNSEAYQRTSKPIEGNLDAEPELYARMNVKVLRAGQLFDSIELVLKQGRTEADKKRTAQQEKRKKERPGASNRDRFVEFFRRDEGASAGEYTSGIPHALRLMNSREYQSFPLVNQLVREKKAPKEIIETLYLSTLSRRPTSQEEEFLLSKVSKPGDTSAYNDILWALLNCSELVVNH